VEPRRSDGNVSERAAAGLDKVQGTPELPEAALIGRIHDHRQATADRIESRRRSIAAAKTTA
jgi:hypothetical protein